MTEQEIQALQAKLEEAQAQLAGAQQAAAAAELKLTEAEARASTAERSLAEVTSDRDALSKSKEEAEKAAAEAASRAATAEHSLRVGRIREATGLPAARFDQVLRLAEVAATDDDATAEKKVKDFLALPDNAIFRVEDGGVRTPPVKTTEPAADPELVALRRQII